jgi:hypothetical protein
MEDNEDVTRAITRDPETMHGVPVFQGARSVSRFHRRALSPYNLANEKHVREQRAQMDGCVQIVDQLRTDDRLG